MFCNNCGNQLDEGNKFCNSCGKPVVIEPVKEEIPVQPVENVQPVVNKPKKGNKALLITLISVLGVGLLVGAFFLVKGLFFNGTESEKAKKEYITNTTWYASDNSEMIFNEDRLYWYEKPTVHDDNYYSGTYKFYIGKEAVDYLTTELSSYGVTKEEIEQIFNRSDLYDESNFVILDVMYDEYMLNGKMQTIKKPQNPYFGFILKDNTYLDVASMNTGTYFKFTKK